MRKVPDSRADRELPMSSCSKKPDRRVQRSQRALVDALIQLMLEKGYAETTVSDIVERANVGRSTFYAHFADKEDLLQQSLQGLREFLTNEALIPPERDGPTHPALTFALPMFMHAYEQKTLFQRLMAAQSSAPVQEHLQILLTDLVTEKLTDLEIANTEENASEIPNGMRAHFIVGAFLAVLLHWIADPGEETPQEIDRKFRRLMLEGGLGASQRKWEHEGGPAHR